MIVPTADCTVSVAEGGIFHDRLNDSEWLGLFNSVIRDCHSLDYNWLSWGTKTMYL